MRVRAAIAAVILVAGPAACRDHGSVKQPKAAADESDVQARQRALAAARVWAAPDVPPGDVNFAVNTAGPGGFDPNADVDCTFVPEPVSGSTPKFMCALADGDHVKVKYGKVIPNGEVPAEIAATRLLSALGFPTDRMNRVHSVRCRGCPLLPQQALQCLDKKEPATVCLQGASVDHVVTFENALIERPLEGDKVEASKGQGWSWYELDAIDPKAGGSNRAEVDALRLMAILLAHWDNKGANQKLLCLPGQSRPDGACEKPIAAIGDLGGTFGPTRVDLVNWRQTPMWADRAACRVTMKALPYDGATFKDVQISEAGRQFALRLLRPLSAEQLNTLFEASGVTAFPHVLAAARQPQAWTAVFLSKVDEIANAGPCPPS